MHVAFAARNGSDREWEGPLTKYVAVPAMLTGLPHYGSASARCFLVGKRGLLENGSNVWEHH